MCIFDSARQFRAFCTEIPQFVIEMLLLNKFENTHNKQPAIIHIK